MHVGFYCIFFYIFPRHLTSNDAQTKKISHSKNANLVLSLFKIYNTAHTHEGRRM